MLHDLFGEITFSVGWKANRNIVLFGKEYTIGLKVKAYFEEDGITKQQELAYKEFTKYEDSKLQTIERLLNNYSNYADTRILPKVLLFERDGSYALLCDDNNQPDEGIAVCLSPDERVVSQDDYL